MAVVVQAPSGDRLAAKQSVAVKVVAELFQEAEDVCDTADGGQGEGVLLLLEVGWTGDTDTGSNSLQYKKQSFVLHKFTKN